MSVCLCHFSSHQKLCGSSVSLQWGLGLSGPYQKSFLVIFWKLQLLVKVQTALTQHHLENTLAWASQNAWKSALLSQEAATTPTTSSYVTNSQPGPALCYFRILSGISWVTPGRKRCEIKSGTKDPFPAPAEVDGNSPVDFSNTNVVKNRSILNSLLCLQLM